MLLRLLLILILSLSAVPAAQAWNSAGHMAINLLAWEALTKQEREQLTGLLEQHPRFTEHFEGRMPPNIWKGSDAEKKQWLFAFTATWPDIVRRPSPGVTAQDVVAQDPALKSLATEIDLTPKTWLLESYELAKEHVYDAAIRGAIIAAEGEAELPPLNPPPEYSVNARKIAETRAKLAGQRMAALLHELLGEIKFEPIPDPMKSERAAPNTSPQALTPVPAAESVRTETMLTHWLNTHTNKRHNQSCRWYGDTDAGRACTADEGEKCLVCGG